MYFHREIRLALATIIAVFAIIVAGAWAADYYVATTGSNSTGDGSDAKPWKTITYALGQVTGTSSDPATIHIAAGTYSRSATAETYPLNMESWVSLSGEHRDTTILDAKGEASSVICCDNVIDFTIENLTITGGKATGDWDHGGPGISCRSSSLNILNNTITYNSISDGPGGGIACYYSSPLIMNNTITHNGASWGGGILCSYSSPTIANNTISYNTRSSGAIYCHGSSPLITNNIITHNTSSFYGSGGIDCLSSSPVIINNTIAFNSGPLGGGVCTWLGGCSPTITNCIFWGNGDDLYEGADSHLSATYCCVQDAGEGNTHGDPAFVPGPLGDYYLDPQSPCIDKGSRTAEQAGLDDRTTRVDGVHDTGQVDMGYHYPEGSELHRYVDAASGDDNHSGHCWDHAFKTIQKAIDDCTEGTCDDPDVIHVAEGSYHEKIVLDSNITMLGGYPAGGGARDPAANETVIDAHDLGGSVVTIDAIDCVTIDGFTIQNGSATNGGGIYCFESSTAITNNVITGNYANGCGGAIYAGGLAEGSYVARLTNDLIAGNSAKDYGGGICIGCYVHASIVNCTIADNEANTDGDGTGGGGGIYVICEDYTSAADILNCIFWGDSPDEIGATSMCMVMCEYSDVDQDGYGDSTDPCLPDDNDNIRSNPKFVPTADPPYTYYLAHTGPQAGNSPCLDAGLGDVSDWGLENTTTCTDGRADVDDDGDDDTGPIDMGYHYPDKYRGSCNTFIELVSFTARPVGARIVLDWETGAEIDNAGFVVYRAIAGTTDYQQLSGLIPAQGTPTSGASYSFTDGDVEAGVSYDYWLVDIDASGKWTAHGPVSARLAALRVLPDVSAPLESHPRGTERRGPGSSGSPIRVSV